MDQQRGVRFLGRYPGQVLQLVLKISEECIAVDGRADHVAHLLLDMNALGKGTEVESDHGALKPFARGGDGFVSRWGMGIVHGCPERHGWTSDQHSAGIVN